MIVSDKEQAIRYCIFVLPVILIELANLREYYKTHLIDSETSRHNLSNLKIRSGIDINPAEHKLQKVNDLDCEKISSIGQVETSVIDVTVRSLNA